MSMSSVLLYDNFCTSCYFFNHGLKLLCMPLFKLFVCFNVGQLYLSKEISNKDLPIISIERHLKWKNPNFIKNSRKIFDLKSNDKEVYFGDVTSLTISITFHLILIIFAYFYSNLQKQIHWLTSYVIKKILSLFAFSL